MLSTVLNILGIVNLVICGLFLFCYSYQFILYIPITLLAKPKPHKETTVHKIAVLICAHNEEAVVGNLIDSLSAQDYPADQRKIFVMADNCTDKTVEVAEAHGATVFERHDTSAIGKGYALDALLKNIDETAGKHAFDAFVVFDADNLAEPDFLTEINKTFSDGFEIVTSYRNSKNYADSWISAGSGMWFLRDCRYLNGARAAIGSSAVLAGTGFLFSDKIKEECGGWPFHCLTEDTEFMICNILKGYKVGYAPDAMFYDEQPSKFLASWNQRLRWAKGGLQVFAKYFGGLVRGIFSSKFITCYDFSMSVAPAYILSLASVAVNIARIILDFAVGNGAAALIVALEVLLGLYGMVLIVAFFVTLTEWKKINAPAWKKVLYTFTFPIFMMTYVPICFIALFVKVKWKAIPHTDGESLDEVRAKAAK
ncbi:MAG: glycosyltransferase [Clostridia bacterium]|nr:glycosyltransferase [Clostridia bacterium]